MCGKLKKKKSPYLTVWHYERSAKTDGQELLNITIAGRCTFALSSDHPPASTFSASSAPPRQNHDRENSP